MNDITAIRTLLDELTDAWNRGDGTAYGAGFTHDATYISFLGTLYQGSADIAASHQALFDSLVKGTRLASEIVDIRFYGADTAMVTSRGDTYKKKPGKLTKIQTYTVVRQADGRWLVAAFHNTKRKPLMEAFTFKAQPKSRPLAP